MIHRRDWLRRAAALAGASIGFPALAQSDTRIVLGQSAAFSGPAAQLGIQMNAGARLYFDRINAAGGVNGRQIELRTLDDGYEPDRCKANTAQFIQDEVFALFGYVGTPTSLAALPLVNEAQIPFFGPFTGAEGLRDPLSRWVFHVRASYFDETAAIVKQLTTIGLKKIAVFRQDDSYGQAGFDGVARALKAQGLEPHAVGTVKRNTVDVAAAVEAIVSKKPDAVVQISAYKSCAAFIRAARAAGYGGSFFNVSFVGTRALADELGADARGVMISQVMPSPYSAALPISREYLEAVKARPEAAPNYSSIEGYVAARVLVEGLKRAGRSLNRAALVAALESIEDMSVGGFRVNYGARRHVGSTFVDLTMLDAEGRLRR
jgi:ABC-type branched-subunit amino acid transport system substrate-binding protein